MDSMISANGIKWRKVHFYHPSGYASEGMWVIVESADSRSGTLDNIPIVVDEFMKLGDVVEFFEDNGVFYWNPPMEVVP